jgi:hypothetical protein
MSRSLVAKQDIEKNTVVLNDISIVFPLKHVASKLDVQLQMAQWLLLDSWSKTHVLNRLSYNESSWVEARQIVTERSSVGHGTKDQLTERSSVGHGTKKSSVPTSKPQGPVFSDNNNTSNENLDLAVALAKVFTNAIWDREYECLRLWVTGFLINHSCNPNCKVEGAKFTSLQKISKQDEITIAYFLQANYFPAWARSRAFTEMCGTPCLCSWCLQNPTQVNPTDPLSKALQDTQWKLYCALEALDEQQTGKDVIANISKNTNITPWIQAYASSLL